MILAHPPLKTGSKNKYLLRRKSPIVSVICTLVLLLFVGQTQAQQNKGPGAEPPLVDESYSLKADREALEELRQNIPGEVKRENDEKAFMDGLMSDLSRSPSEVRNKFSSLLGKKRERFSKDMNKAREEFNKAQKKDREAFTKELADQRKEFSRKKVSSEERKEFFDSLESRRKDFYADQKEKRDEFEADSRDKRKNFDDYVRAKNGEFNQLHRDYSKRYEENKKALKDQSQQAELRRKQQQKDLESEYEAIKNKPPTYLGP